MIRFNCVCGRQLQADRQQAGSRASCPVCTRVVTVPDETAGVRHADPWYSTAPAPARVPPSKPPVASAAPAPVPPSERPVTRESPEVAPDPGSASKDLSGKAVVSFLLAVLLTLLWAAVAANGPLPVRFGVAIADTLLVGLAAVALRDVARSRGQLAGGWMAWISLVAALCCLVANLSSNKNVTEGTYDPIPLQLNNQMKQLGLALHNYAAANGHLPPAVSRGPDGKPLLSWRVAILPYLEEEQLYKQFHQDEPWDSPHNIKLLESMPRVFDDPSGNAPRGTTRFQVYVGPGTAFEGPNGQTFAEITKGAAGTIFCVEGPDPVPWTKPVDLPFGPQVALVRPYPRDKKKPRYYIGVADGTSLTIPADTPEDLLRALISRNGEKVDWPGWR